MDPKTRIHRTEHSYNTLPSALHTLVMNHVLYTIHTGRKWNGSGTQTIGPVRNSFVNWCWVRFQVERKRNSNHRASAQLFCELMLSKVSRSREFHVTFQLASFSVSLSLAICVNKPAIPRSSPWNVHRQCRRILNYARPPHMFPTSEHNKRNAKACNHGL